MIIDMQVRQKSSLISILNQAKKDPLSDKNWHDIFLKMKHLREMKKQLDELVAVRLENNSVDIHTDFMQYVLSNLSGELTLDFIINAIENVFEKKLTQFEKSKMLLVEDELAVSEAMECVLEDAFDIDLAQSSDAAMSIVRVKKCTI